MQSLLNLTVVIILLYILYKFVGGYLLPRLSERRLQRYKQQFYHDNPQVDPAALDQRRREQEARQGIPFRRHRKR